MLGSPGAALLLKPRGRGALRSGPGEQERADPLNSLNRLAFLLQGLGCVLEIPLADQSSRRDGFPPLPSKSPPPSCSHLPLLPRPPSPSRVWEPPPTSRPPGGQTESRGLGSGWA